MLAVLFLGLKASPVACRVSDPDWIRIRIGSGLDLDSIGPVDPDPNSESGSESRRAKMTHKRRNFFVKVHVLKCYKPLLRAEGFFCNLDILYGGLGIGKLQIDQKQI